MAGSTFKTIGNIGAASGAASAVGARDTFDGADDVRREVRVERDRRAPRSTSNQQLNALIAPTAAAKNLIGLAGRMGIPTEDAVRCVLKHLSDRHPLAAAVVEPENGQSGSAPAVLGVQRYGRRTQRATRGGDVRFRTRDVVQFKDARAGRSE
jgi:hypothetical protein